MFIELPPPSVKASPQSPPVSQVPGTAPAPQSPDHHHSRPGDAVGVGLRHHGHRVDVLLQAVVQLLQAEPGGQAATAAGLR